MEEPEVSLREITADTVREICRLRVAPGQEGFVAPVAESIAEAHFSPLVSSSVAPGRVRTCWQRSSTAARP